MYCERITCLNSAVFSCDRCAESSMPTSFGQFCSRDCQMLAYKSHTQAHRLMGTLNTKAQSEGRLVESVAIALKDAANRRLLPSLRNGTVLSLLFVGCKDFVEGNTDFFRLYERLIGLELYAPECSFTLEVTLVGPELTTITPVAASPWYACADGCSGCFHQMQPTIHWRSAM
jgi:hypothetical protein